MVNKNKKRCPWCLSSDLYIRYHDTEWGTPVYDDALLFEMLILETMQAGLSWITILKKRDNYRMALDNFNYKIIAGYDSIKVEELMHNAGIIRHRAKILSIINNAQQFIKLREQHRTFSDYIWKYINHQPIKNEVIDYKTAPATTALSDRIAQDLKKAGFKFIGSTTVYSFMQAAGLVNDHQKDCFRYYEI